MARRLKPGCLLGGGTLVVILLLATWTGITGYQQNKRIDNFTTSEPQDLNVTYSPVAEVEELRERVREFGEKAKAGEPVELTLSPQELNDLIGHEEALFNLRKVIAFTEFNDQLEAQLSMPLKTLFQGGAYRYLNGTIRMKPQVKGNQILLAITSIDSEKGLVDEGFINFFHANFNLLHPYREDKEIGPALERITALHLIEGKLVIRANG